MARPLHMLISALCLSVPALTAANTFDQCLDDIRIQAHERGVSPNITETLLADVTPSERVIELDRSQPEFTSTLHGYLSRRVTDERIERGRALLAEHAELLNRIEREQGVAGRYLIAFWGLETNYGSYFGRMSTVRSLATLACDRRRGAFFRNELIEAMALVDERTLSADQLYGSWAGALGNFQFLPSVYRAHAVDADGDGRIDLWESFPDAAESAARFLRARGWEPGERWGREVRLPEGFDYALADTRRELNEWAALGVRRADGGALPASEMPAELLIPAGSEGPAFLVYENFNVIMRWNPSRFYAISVGLLADQVVGGPGLINSPPNEPALRIATIEKMQENLNARGYDVGGVDGRIGPMTRAALRAFQHAAGLTPDGHPDSDTLEALGISHEGG